ncbi:hypothetical protein MAR_035472, partial [Mya arenaria]
QLILVLTKLGPNISKMNLAVRFGLSDTTVSRVIRSWFDVLNTAFQSWSSNYWPQEQIWSNCKHQHTTKYLIGIAFTCTPQGAITFI